MGGTETDSKAGVNGGANISIVEAGDHLSMPTGGRGVQRFVLDEPQVAKVRSFIQYGTSQAVSDVLDEFSEYGSRDGRVDWKITTAQFGCRFVVIDVGQKGDRLGDHFSFAVETDNFTVANLRDCTEQKVRAFLAGVKDITCIS